MMTGASLAAAGLVSMGAAPARAQASDEWDKTFARSENVTQQKVAFTNRYGITLTGELYMPADRGDAALPALAIAGPFGAVKEQSAGLYAQSMAERGFVTLAFDPSFVGESGGEVRDVASPDINTEDFMAAVDYLGLHYAVERERIVAVDKRAKAVATTSMYDMSRVMARGYHDSLTDEQRAEGRLPQMSRQRCTDAENGAPAMAGGLPDSLDGINDPVIRMYHAYYKTDRGYHPRSVNSNGGWTVTNPLSFMNMPLLTYIAEISPRPMLVVAGSEAHSRYLSEDAYAAAADPKELMIIDGADHVDLHDQLDVIPFDWLAEFFGEHLAA
jgi:uncharacterized protein